MDGDIEEVDTAELKAECESNWRKLKSVHADLEHLSSQQNTTGAGVVDGDRALELLQQYEKRLKAEILFLEENEPRTLPENKEIQQIVLEQDQRKCLEELEEVLVLFRGKRSEVTVELQQAEETHSQLMSLNETLKKKISSQRLDEESVTTQTVLEETNVTLNKVKAKHRYFRAHLKDILYKHFPTPQQTSEATLNESRTLDLPSMLPFSSVIGRLIEQSLNSPAQPYIEIDEKLWPHHVEFLLRCQIAVKDPHDSNRMKLVPFHL
ncbi:hypothetical protein Btru_056863 [Bulinus truncatus]|nr:hypothetical protein Btru_056863 [Bulinus truncatus]